MIETLFCLASFVLLFFIVQDLTFSRHYALMRKDERLRELMNEGILWITFIGLTLFAFYLALEVTAKIAS